MADVEALRAKIVELGAADAIRRGGRFNVNDLHARLTSHFQGEPPISRATMYAWFGNDGAPPKQSLLVYSQINCRPRVDRMGVSEYFVHGSFFVRRHLEALNGGTGSAPEGTA